MVNWGKENDPKYLERKKKKLEIYKKYDYNLIELNDDDLTDLDVNLVTVQQRRCHSCRPKTSTLLFFFNTR